MNYACLVGRIIEPWRFNHDDNGKRYVTTTLCVDRISDKVDFVPIVACDDDLPQEGTVKVIGDVRSRMHDNRRNLFVLVDDIHQCDETTTHDNEVFISGEILKVRKTRETKGGEKITSVAVGVRKKSGSVIVIPAVVWDENSDIIRRVPNGTGIELAGRIQSRVVVLDGAEHRIENISVFRMEVQE